MLAIERRKLFLDTINTNGIATVTALAQLAEVTEETVRRDLQILEREGHIVKTHGGAVPNETVLGDIAVEVRQNMNLALKTEIASAAAGLVNPGETIFLDASTTALCFSKMLRTVEGVRVITNSLPVINELSHQQNVKLVGMCGQFVLRNQSFIGDAAKAFIRDNYVANKVFFSCKGVSEDGTLFESDEGEAAVKRTMLDCSIERIMLCDNTKFGRFGNIRLGSLDGVSAVVTNQELLPPWKELFESKGILVIYSFQQRQDSCG